MLQTPVSGSRVMQSVAVRYGAASKPGVEIGTGRLARPPSGQAQIRHPLLATTSWHGGELTATGQIGFAIAPSHAVPISSTAQPMPIA